jgi:hypothetical protein
VVQDGPLGGDRIRLGWGGEVQGPCDWVALYDTDKDGPAPTDSDSYIGLNGWEWVVAGDRDPDGYPLGTSRHVTGKNPSGPVDAGKGFWMGYVDGFGRFLKLTKLPRSRTGETGERVAAGRADEMTIRSPSPNPTVAATTLRFSLPEAALVRLELFDPAGRRVRQLTRGPRGAGEHEVSWDLRNESGVAVSSGVYFARLVAGDHALTQKVMVTR